MIEIFKSRTNPKNYMIISNKSYKNKWRINIETGIIEKGVFSDDWVELDSVQVILENENLEMIEKFLRLRKDGNQEKLAYYLDNIGAFLEKDESSKLKEEVTVLNTEISSLTSILIHLRIIMLNNAGRCINESEQSED